MQYQNISLKQFLVAKGLSYDVTMAMVVFSHVYFHVGRYHVFALKLTWYFTDDVYTVNYVYFTK